MLGFGRVCSDFQFDYIVELVLLPVLVNLMYCVSVYCTVDVL